MSRTTRIIGLFTAGLLAASAAQADIITCGGPSGTRVLVLDTGVTASGTCASTGTGNLGDGGRNGLASLVAGLEGSTDLSVLERDEANSASGLLEISGVSSSTGGDWWFGDVGPVAYLYFHFGNGGGGGQNAPATNPDWFLFRLTSTGTASGSWLTSFVSDGANWTGLSNVALISVRSQVPEPATLGLLGLGLCGVALARRRRKAA